MKNTLIFSILFLMLFGFGEVLYHLLKIKAEITRKIVHIGTGVITLLFPFWLDSHWFVLILCVNFFILLTLSLKFNFLKSINAIERFSIGSMLYPFAVYLSYFVYEMEGRKLHFFFLPMLSLAFCDPLAEFFGKKYPYKKFTIWQSTKSIGGSLAFFVSCLILSFGVLIFYFTLLETLFFTFLIAFFTTIAEGISGKGIDNIMIPFTVAIILKVVSM